MAKKDKELEVDEEFGTGIIEEPEDSTEEELEKSQDSELEEKPETEEQEPLGRGDGHRPSVGDLSDEKQAAFEERELDRAIPGRGHLFNVKKKFLHESTELNEAEVFSFAIGDVQKALYDHNRTESVFEILENAIMGYRISLKRKGRGESIILHQLTTEEKQAAADGGLLDRP